jgi:hypothetical protein
MSAARALEVPETSGGTLTVELLEQIVLKACPETGKFRRPDPKSLGPLAETLNRIAETGAISLADSRKLRLMEEERLAQGLSSYASRAGQRELMAYFKGRLSVAAETGNQRDIETETRNFAACERIVAFFRKPSVWRSASFGWHSIAEEVADAFKTAMLSTNPKAPDNSQRGPVARFVSAVVPYITGEKEPSPVAVGAHLTRCAAQQRQGRV